MRTRPACLLAVALGVALGVALVAAGCGRGGGADSERADGTLPPWLPARQLMQLVAAKRAVVFDTRARGEFRLAHIAGAWPLPLEELNPPDGELDGAARERLAAALARSGFEPGADLVVTDGGGPEGLRRAATGCWLLSLAGARRCALLAGGVDAWRAAGGALAAGEPATPPRPAPVRIYARPPALASLEFVRETTARPEGAVVDVREQVRDAIPGAFRWPLPQPVATTESRPDGAPFDLRALERSAAATGLFAEREPIVVGERLADGALAWFVLRDGLGVRDARLFPGGIAAWRAHPALPFAPAAPRPGDQP